MNSWLATVVRTRCKASPSSLLRLVLPPVHSSSPSFLLSLPSSHSPFSSSPPSLALPLPLLLSFLLLLPLVLSSPSTRMYTPHRLVSVEMVWMRVDSTASSRVRTSITSHGTWRRRSRRYTYSCTLAARCTMSMGREVSTHPPRATGG